ncbi:hypothetical protein C3747_40g233 [Trypanosoma cruzi]|uniref:Uncharacterized protein n=1 Tax=Trypanosoma cruzi TaxID=5693 RepID=A0A2V2WZA4_TRYCR|nr:hypothetical protein C3747_40g233 [Trypanosoma cruzi]
MPTVPSPASRQAYVVVLAVMVSLLFISAADAEEIVIGVLDGSHKLTAEDIKNGFKANDKNFINSCGKFDVNGDKFVLIIEMGNFTDYLIPQKGVHLCDLLTSPTREQKYLYAPQDPRDATWDGHTFPVTPSIYEDALGGSAEGYVNVERSTLSFWGDNGSNDNHTGGCCALMPGQNAAWYRPYRLLFSPKEPAMYLAWGTKPTVAVPNVPVVFEVNLWNMRSEPVLENVTFNITTNGKKVTVTSPTGRYTHFANASDPSAAKYTIIVDLVSGPDTVNTRQLKAVVDVFGKIPWDVTPTAGENIPALVRFGKAGTAIGPVDGIAALDEDWFASSIVGGESRIRPVAGHFNTVEPYTLPPVRDKWENVTQADGVFRVQVPCKSVQYYAVAVYSAAVQRIVLQYEFDTAAVMYFAGKRFVPREQGGSRRGSFAVGVMQGYHQVLVKLFSDNSTATEDPRKCTAVSSFSMRVVGTAVGYTHAVMPDIPEGAYEIWNNNYMFYLLHLGEQREEYLYGALDEDFINVSTAIPKPGEHMSGKFWKVFVFYGGRIPVSAESLPKDKEAAVSYVAIALYSGYEEKVPVGWTFITGGKTDFYIDGKPVYSRPSDTGPLKENFTTPVSRGWHQLIVRIAATKGQSWGLTFYIHFDNYRLGSAHTTGSNLPFGVAPIRPNRPLLSLMELVDIKSRVGAIPFNPLNNTAVADEFADLPIDASYMPGLLSNQSIWTLGRERQYQWVGRVSTDGIWGHRPFGGNSNQYWSVVLYATESMEATARVIFHGGYAMWLDGQLVGSSPLSSEKEVRETLPLNKGWNQLVIKLRANNSFHLIDTRNSRMSWTAANALCAETRRMELCPLSAVCPFGVGRPGVFPVPEGSSFVPVKNDENEWVQVFAGGGNGTSMCETWRDAHDGRAPIWGETGDNITERHLVPCCGDNSAPFIWLSITPSSTAEGELGYTYEIPVVVEAPVLTVDDPAAVTQTVTITCATPGATIKYAVNNAEEMALYTRPFTISESSTIFAQAFAQSRESRRLEVFVEIKSPIVDRVACVENERCPLFVSGVDPRWRMAIINTKSSGKGVKEYFNLTYALEQPPSLDFSGVLDIEEHRVVVPPLRAGTFNVIVYNTDARGRMAVNTLAYKETRLTPSEVVGTQKTLFKIEGGVNKGDVLLLPFTASRSSATCDADACTAALKSQLDRVAVLSSSVSAYFKQDLYGYSGKLSCLCICLSCYKGVSKQDSVLIESSKVVNQVVNVSVSSPVPHAKATVGAIRPFSVRNGDDLEMFGTFITDSSYIVRFNPAVSGGDTMAAPTCAVQKVTTGVLTCEMQVQAGTVGGWNVSLLDGEAPVPFEEGAVNTIHVLPPDPLVEFAAGNCAAASVNCVTGAEVIFRGKNFNPVYPLYNDVVVGDAASANPILCRVTNATEKELFCVLSIPRGKEHGKHSIQVRVRVSETEWGAEQSAGFLVLGAGADVPGWKADNVPPSVPVAGGNSKYVVIIIVAVLGAVLLALIVAVVVMYFRFRAAAVKADEEIISLELQLLNAGHERAELPTNKQVKGL